MRCTSRCSICVSGRCGMNRSALRSAEQAVDDRVDDQRADLQAQLPVELLGLEQVEAGRVRQRVDELGVGELLDVRDARLR